VDRAQHPLGACVRTVFHRRCTAYPGGNDSSKALREAAEFYKVEVGAITAKVKQEFATKDKARAAKTAMPKPAAQGAKKPIAA
jgi:ParB family chromosome partitioning protein